MTIFWYNLAHGIPHPMFTLLFALFVPAAVILLGTAATEMANYLRGYADDPDEEEDDNDEF